MDASEYTSAASVGGWSSRTSGAACHGVNWLNDDVRSSWSAGRAMPKSLNAGPKPESRMFSGFTSRCRTPAWWAAARASAMEAPARMASASANVP
nr:hypothetical protein [Aquihabitans sp. G128]